MNKIAMSTVKLTSKLRLLASNSGLAVRRKLLSLSGPERTIPALQLSLSNKYSTNYQKPQTSEKSRYLQVHEESLSRPEEFWAEQAEQVVWFKKWDKVLDYSNPPAANWSVSNH